MKTNNANRGAGFSLAKTLFAAIVALMVTFLASAQTNINLSNTGPYYSISNLVAVGNGYLINSDPIKGGVTFDYTQGTNALGQAIQPGGVNRSRYVGFGLVVAITISAAVNYTAIIQEGTGGSDWVSLVPSLVVTTAAGSNTVWSTVSTNATYDTGGFTQFRVKSVQSVDLGNTNAVISIPFSSKVGI
jgi:hypothetical protein